jgi:Xaa-Pro aminopeptidase
MHDRAMEAAMASAKPGMRVCDVAAVAEYVVKCYGCFPDVLLANAAPIGTPAPLGPKTNTHVLQPGDGFTLLVESSGPGGMFTELGRTGVVGKATDVMLEELDFSIRAQQFCNDRLKPGALCRDVFDEYNQFMRENGRPEERRIHCHGQGYDLVERPLIRNDESMRIEDTMNITTHPMYARNGYYSWLCDNFRVGPEGVTQRIHKIPQKIFELG